MSSKVAKNFVYLIISQLATWCVTLVVLVVVPRYLGPDSFGQVGFATSFIALFSTVAGLGTSPLLIKMIARDQAVLGPYVLNAVVLKILLLTLLSIAAIVVAALIGVTGVALALVAIGCVGMFLIVLNDIFVGALGGLERMGRPAMWGVVKVYIAGIGGVLVLLLGGGVIAYASVVALAGAAPLIANGRTVRPWLQGSHLDADVWKLLVRAGLPLMMLTGLTKVYGTIDVPILRGITDDTTVGWYTLAYRFVTVPIFIATTATQAFFPTFSAHGATLSDQFSRQVNRAVRLVVIVSVPAAAGISAVAGDFVDLLYGSRYEEAAPIMQILALHLPFAAVGFVLGSALVASDRQRAYVIIAAVSAAISPIIYVVAINWAERSFDNGGIGAAVATVGIEVCMLAGALLIRARGVMDRATASSCVRSVVAGGIMTGVVWWTDGVPLGIRVVIGVVVYAVASLLIGAVRLQELREGVATFRDVFDKRRRGKSRPTVDVVE